MAPPTFPNGLSLYAIGFAALKYPALPPPPTDVPLGNIVGALQYTSPSAQHHIVAQIASQYLNALIEYQTSDEPTLHDPSLPQYYISTALVILNFLASSSPDVCKRAAQHPALLNDVIEKLLTPDFEDRMKAVVRPPGPRGIPPAKFDDDFGTLLQFVSTMLLYRAEMAGLHPQIDELIPKLREWKRTYRNSPVKTIKNASERLVEQIQGMDLTMVAMMRRMQETSLVCGVTSCRITGAERLTVCNGCKIQRYCGRDHQKADWKYHKHICNKGLVEPAEG
ncbi:hypothetical protein N431DRAFT_438918 [Stipitochalara longipes BDJ]|nr:hypothetical protein N431DRAFT_438918 [Stipitochalara longipes BDJ]